MRPDIRPMLATLTDKPFDNPDWIFETKWDGFRAVAVVAPGKAKLYSRNGLDISRKYPSIVDALAKIKESAVLDGELVALDARGRSRFQLLQNAEREKVRLLYRVFDLLYLDGMDTRKLKLIERKAALKAILAQEQAAALQRACRARRHRGIREGKACRGRGRDGEARLEPLPLRRTHPRLVEGQGASRTRSGDRRLHRASPLPQIFRGAGAGGARVEPGPMWAAPVLASMRRGCVTSMRSWRRCLPTRSRSWRKCRMSAVRPGSSRSWSPK